jgi:hypothetical protein
LGDTFRTHVLTSCPRHRLLLPSTLPSSIVARDTPLQSRGAFHSRQSCSRSLLTFPSPPRAQFPGILCAQLGTRLDCRRPSQAKPPPRRLAVSSRRFLLLSVLRVRSLHPRCCPSCSESCETGETLRKQTRKSGETGGVSQEHKRSLRTIDRCQAPLRGSSRAIEV